MSEMENSPSYLFFWEKEWKQLIVKDGLTLLDTSETTDPMRKGRLFLVAVSRVRANRLWPDARGDTKHPLD